jgi:hypothetical protein
MVTITRPLWTHNRAACAALLFPLCYNIPLRKGFARRVSIHFHHKYSTAELLTNLSIFTRQLWSQWRNACWNNKQDWHRKDSTKHWLAELLQRNIFITIFLVQRKYFLVFLKDKAIFHDNKQEFSKRKHFHSTRWEHKETDTKIERLWRHCCFNSSHRSHTVLLLQSRYEG